ncbi:MAG: molecular chaperone DnaJ [Acaryochloris sp. RU_4_1]|nr:molecular chaperone DnaJ [Acaryochloris sp. SU_5_25]NJM64511.1 molecular chaperone DnaJ [Acaryochloris sp. RU_4_1]NJN39357.1 molecular chaperone DnaJ [Acaryochloridaceae cyanobacterium CSU_3_4]NJR53404.1 molecular chaperone DnaJ [Acaryochloris sp. CRU_2_0]
MSEQNPYDILEVAENASFEDIQTARDRIISLHPEDESCRQTVEAAYDSVLMDRLRKRQEGKIKVPEGIRFAERLTEKKPPKKLSIPPINPAPNWFQQSLDQPEAKEVAIVGACYTALAGFALFSQSVDTLAFLLALGVGFSLYWLNRKEQKLGRALLLTLTALVMGALIGSALLQTGLQTDPVQPQALLSCVMFVLLWLVDSFLR